MELNIFEAVKTLPIVDVLRDYCHLQQKGSSYYALCPFHDDHKIGSFVITPQRNAFHCFACGAKGDAVDYVAHVCQISALEAAARIAESHSLISHERAISIMQSRNQDPIEFQKSVALVRPEYKVVEKKDIEHLNKVYGCFVKACRPLTPEMRMYLIEKRHIESDDLDKYFTFPISREAKEFWPRFRRCLSEAFDQADYRKQNELLLGVPGFFIGNDGRLKCMFTATRHLGIKVFDRDGLISGIQLRCFDKNCTTRYKFLSSGFANGAKDSSGSYGCSCGFVEDVLYPKKAWNRTIAVTEGRFKAEILSQLGFLTVNMHGISNWAPVSKVVNALASKNNVRLLILCYDAEDTPQVKHSAKKLCELLNGMGKVEFAVWDPQYGKGIDDVVNAGNIKHISRITSSEFFQAKVDKPA